MRNMVMMTYFIADTHFGDESIIRYENRPFKDASEMDVFIMNQWNNTVSPEDVVFVLGDFTVYTDKVKIKQILDALNGNKILVMGNHDRDFDANEWRECGFNECIPWPIVFKEYFILSHEPLYINSNMPYANIFGHVHGNPAYKDASIQSVCVSAERINYTPVAFEELVAAMK